jgi:hypothetical protein
MMWRQFCRLSLFLLLWLPAASFGQTASGGSNTASSPLNVYAPPCVSQVKQYIAVNCQITPTGGAQPYSYAFTGGFPTGISMSTGLGGGLISGTPTGITAVQATVTVTDVRGGTAATSFMITPTGLTGSGPCGSAICVTGAGYAIKTADGYTITTLAPVQMAATTYWSDGSTLDVTSMATWACDPSPQCGSVSATGLYTAGNSVGTYHVTAAFSGVTNDGGAGVAVTVASIEAHTKESDRVANSGRVMREVLQLRSGIPAAVLQKAECVVVVPSTLKFAAGVGGRALEGLHTGGRVFGYRHVPIEKSGMLDAHGRSVVDGVRLEVEPAQADTVRRIFERYAAGDSMKRIAIDMNAEGIQSPQPQKGRILRSWCQSSIHHILHNERYRGLVIWGKTYKLRSADTGKRIYRRKPASEWRRTELPAQRIITDKLWEAAQSRMRFVHDLYGTGAKNGIRGGRAAGSPYLFTDFSSARCAVAR